MKLATSSCEITFTQGEKGPCLLKFCRTRNIAMLFPSDYITIGIRELVSTCRICLWLTLIFIAML